MSTGLSRIERIANHVLPGSRIADVGTDHGLLPIYLLQHRIATWVVASDLRSGPLAAARRNVADAGLGHEIDLRLGSGLTTVKSGEVDAVVIAGMGGKTIVDILQESPEVVQHLRRFILQPMGGARLVREYLNDQGLAIADEEVFVHQDKFYELLVAESGEFKDLYSSYPPGLPREMALEFGPILLNHPTETFVRFLIDTKDRWQASLAGLQLSNAESAIQRREWIEARVAWVNGWLSDHGQATVRL